MKYTIRTTNKFDKDMKRCEKRGYKMDLIKDAMSILVETGSLPAKYRPRKLSGDKEGIWECHIQSDWSMTWEQNDKYLTLLFLQTGTHSDMF